MQRPPMTMEEQLLQKAIREECPWENLPKRLQATLATKDEWHRRITEYCIKKRLQWEKCSARKVCKESEYYEEMIRYLRKNLGLFPYHLAEYVCRVMRLSPFRYYCDMLFEVMKNEQPYDSIPNFSAADALRLTGIGRNEFIDIMNKCRSKKIMWKLNKSIAKELLPTLPVDFAIEPWWGVSLVNFTLDEFKKLSEEEMTTIDKVCKEEANSYILFDADIIKGLYQRGLIYFDVPVYPEDRFKVSRLEGFVSNREQLYEDPIEELLYAVFVASSDNATVAELAATLQADLSQLQGACSFACRLGWAVKYIDPVSVLQDASVSVVSRLSVTDEDNASYEDENGHPFDPKSNIARVAFIVDANITSYLMMGSVSPGLKSHAVTLYEAGKLGHASIPDLCRDLGTLEGAKFEGELQEFANHAFSLRCFLECLLSGGVQNDDSEAPKRQYQIDILRCESLGTLSPATLERLFLRDYDMIVSMVPLSLSAVLPGPKGPIHFGPPSHSFLTPWMKLVLYSVAGVGPLSVVFMKGQCLRLLPAPLAGCDRALIWSWDGSNVGGLGSKFDGNLVKGGVLLHCVNALLKYSAVLVLPLSKHDLDDRKSPVTVDVPLPLTDSGDVSDCLRLELGFSDSDASELTSMLDELRSKVNLSTIGYLRLLKLFNENESARDYRKFEWVPLSIEYGVPLFSRELCKRICRRVVSSGLLQSNSLTGHQEAMHDLRRRVGEICVEYQATGTAAKVLYQKEKTKGSAAKLMNYASGKWNPLLDPSSPISGACSERQRLMLANRHRCKTEVLSFDGTVLRSYALPPVYEASSTQIEEASLVNTLKSEFNEGDPKDVIFPGVNLLFDGSQLHPFDVGACLQARQPVALVADAAAISASVPVPK